MEAVTLHQWRALEPPGPWNKRGGWRTLRHRMTEDDALEYGRKQGVPIEKIPGSAETRTPQTGNTGSLWPPKS